MLSELKDYILQGVKSADFIAIQADEVTPAHLLPTDLSYATLTLFFETITIQCADIVITAALL